MKIINGIFMAWGCFSTIPCPYKKWDEEARNHMLAMVPLVGGLIGLINLVLYHALNWFAVDYRLSALALTTIPFLLSGFMHLDGFMDVSDAVLSRRPLEDRQRILKDSRVGAFAVITTILLFLASYVSVLVMCDMKSVGAVTVYAMIPYATRCVGIFNVMLSKPMETSQFVESYKDDNKTKIARYCMMFHGLMIVLFMLAFLYLQVGILEIFAIPAVMLIQQLVVIKAKKDLGGMNGDIAGYSIVVGELVCALILAIF